MIVDTKTGEVINPRVISHQHTHQHTYIRSMHSKLGAVRRNSLSIFAILAIALIFKFAIYTSGPVYYAAAYIWGANGHDASRIGSVPMWIYLLCMVIADGIYLSVSIFGMNRGRKKRHAGLIYRYR